jgi:hypothetical protein
MTIDTGQFLRDYIGPHEREVAEWGAEVGFWGLDHHAALSNVRKLAESALLQAGNVSPAFIERSRERHSATSAFRYATRMRLRLSQERLTGAKSPSSSSRYRRTIELVADLAVLVYAPVLLVLHWPTSALAVRRYRRLQERENGISELRLAAVECLTLVFERHVNRGILAARIQDANLKQDAPATTAA